MKKKKAHKEEVKDPDVTYALTNSKSKTLADTIAESKEEPITKEEIKRLLDKPDWIWGGMTSVICRIFKRLQLESDLKEKNS